ncbi:Fic/DOC family protein [Ostreiculturibacter nitratireducens]|uniref:Fic/DOC family protein n=1 Tax=Ostreiculturibacter nitratireducens TaxID=3075226 RepID=UPI0031B57E81
MSRYDAADDPLCYPGTGVLRNKAGLKDQDELDQFEQLMFQTRAEEPLPPGNLDYAHYRAIHHHFFQDVYDWAGKPRKIRTAKGGNWFCFPENIEREMDKLFADLTAENHLADLRSIEAFAERASHFIAELNAIHPFREGNGRCQLTLLRELMELAGFPMDEDRIDPEGFMQAMIASFSGRLEPLVIAVSGMVQGK